jgi:hypothetical protein
MRRTSAAFLIALSLAAGVAGCGRNENPQGSPDGTGQTGEERDGDRTTPTE